MDHSVRTAISSVRVTEGGRSDHRVIQRGVEYLSCLGVVCLDPDSGEFPVPVIPCGLSSLVKVPARQFRLHVGICPFHAHRREGHLHQERLPFRIAEMCMGIGRHIPELILPDLDVASEDCQRVERLREFCIEIYLLIRSPATGETVSPEGFSIFCRLSCPRVHRLDECVHGSVPAASVHQVDDYTLGLGCRGSLPCTLRVQPRIALRVGVAVHSHSGCCGELRTDSVSGQGHTVISWGHDFLRTVGIGPQAGFLIGFTATSIGVSLSGHRHHCDIEKISYSGSAQMSVGESYDCRITVMVSRTPVPLLRDAGRSQLDEAERHVRTHEDVTMSAGADLRIDI